MERRHCRGWAIAPLPTLSCRLSNSSSEASILWSRAPAGRSVPTQLLQEAWCPEYSDKFDFVRAYIRRLRKKLEPDPKHPKHILLERGLGYRLVVQT